QTFHLFPKLTEAGKIRGIAREDASHCSLIVFILPLDMPSYSSQQRKVVLKDVYALVDILNQIEPLLERSGWHVKGEYEDHKR
ncbi:hypothetical protein ACC710_37360, partial [Rhizobium ruizarguesonis]